MAQIKEEKLVGSKGNNLPENYTQLQLATVMSSLNKLVRIQGFSKSIGISKLRARTHEGYNKERLRILKFYGVDESMHPDFLDRYDLYNR